MEVIEGKFGKQAPVGFANQLREIADAMDRGDVVEAVVCWVQEGNYRLSFGASINESLVLSTLLQRRATDHLLQGS